MAKAGGPAGDAGKPAGFVSSSARIKSNSLKTESIRNWEGKGESLVMDGLRAPALPSRDCWP